jgi:hypothetical protein
MTDSIINYRGYMKGKLRFRFVLILIYSPTNNLQDTKDKAELLAFKLDH